jgi:membrane protease YdiL (CAAX protease family)
LEHIAGLLPWIAAAVLYEAAAYLTLTTERSRAWWRREWLVASAPLAYVLYAAGTPAWRWSSLAIILAGAAVVTYWFRVFGVGRLSEAMFLVLVAAPLATKALSLVYLRPHEDVRLEFLGQLLLIRLAVLAVTRDLQPEGVNFGFWPEPREWRIGAQWYLILLPFVFALGVASGAVTFVWPPWPWWELAARMVGTFFGVLWVVALSEEFFFRGLLQRWAGIAVASIAFGLVHLAFRGFPNWRFVLVAAAAGVFYGMAYRRGGGIRAAMVTHTLTVVTLKTLFR